MKIVMSTCKILCLLVVFMNSLLLDDNNAAAAAVVVALQKVTTAISFSPTSGGYQLMDIGSNLNFCWNAYFTDRRD